MNWMRYTLGTISILALVSFEQIVTACAGGDEDPYDYFPSYFFKDINKNTAYEAFYYTSWLEYFDGVPDNDANISEWRTYCNNAASAADIDSFVYKYTVDELKAINDAKPSSDVAKNSFTKWLLKSGDKEALNYLVFAKQCEPYAQPEDGYYDRTTYEWKQVPRDADAMAKLIDEGKVKYNAAKADFIKWRYAYQLLRLAFYSRNYDLTLKLYSELCGNKTAQNLMYPRCLGLKAGALYRNRDTIQSAYLYTRVFDMSDEMKTSAHISFSWSMNGNIYPVLDLCKNKHERAVVYVMRGLHDYGDDIELGLDMLQKAYKEDPNVKGLREMMTREINKAEERLLSPNTLYYTDSQVNAIKQQYKPYMGKLNKFSQDVAKENKNNDKAFWLLASAYIYLVQDNYSACREYFALAEKENLTERQKDVLGVSKTLCTLKEAKKLDTETENKLLPSLQWMETKMDKDSHIASVYRHMLQSLMTQRYLKQGDTVRAVYTMDGYYSWQLLDAMSVEQIEHVKSFIAQSNKTNYEKWLVRNSYQQDMLNELEGTKYMRLQMFDKAVEMFKRSNDSAIRYVELPDCFVSHIQDVQDWNKSDSAVIYNKLTLATKLAEMQKIIAANPKDARTLYSYANAMYNMTYYGKGWQAVEYSRSGSEWEAYYNGDERRKAPGYKQPYYNAGVAEKYYMQAFNASDDAELKARCLFMAAKCWQKNCPSAPGKSYYYDEDNVYYKNSQKNPYFKQLKTYKATKFYKQAYSTCGYLADYAKRN